MPQMLWFAIALAFQALAIATPLQASFTSCLDSYLPNAPFENQLRVENVFANLVDGRRAAGLGLIGDGSDVLRVDVLGVTASVVNGYDNATDKLGMSGTI
jgi:hypothetical protein